MWNYRIFRYEQDKENLLYISETYYDDKGKINGYISPIDIFNKGLWCETKDGMREMLSYIKKATVKPIIVLREDETFYEEE